jgi:hypothetical protein
MYSWDSTNLVDMARTQKGVIILEVLAKVKENFDTREINAILILPCKLKLIKFG